MKTEGGTFFCRLGEIPAQKGQKKTIAVRSENIRIGTAAQSSCFLTGKVQEKNFAGGMLHIAVQLPDKTELTISRQGIDIEYELGEQVFLEWEAEKAVFVDENG